MYQKMLDHLVINVNSGNVASGFGLGFGIATIIIWIILVVIWMQWKKKRMRTQSTLHGKR